MSARRKKSSTSTKKYYLTSVDADRKILGVGDFPKGVEVEVPQHVFRSLKDAEGWSGKVRWVRIN